MGNTREKFYAAFSFLSFASSCRISPPFLIFANMSLNLSKSFSAALLFWTISFLPQELNSIDVNLNIRERKPLEVHLAPHHIRGINKSL
ncbi:hypothetical protein CUMW_203960 [Citrus unshiu]|uniref:Uncharacterized protein n=2 Tax=Citrus unshiu TaxID=55188 RepID=A0A2H5Q7T1_CITUN|nr:hypothetical protein CUMW_203960 [Citrus unshiu]